MIWSQEKNIWRSNDIKFPKFGERYKFTDLRNSGDSKQDKFKEEHNYLSIGKGFFFFFCKDQEKKRIQLTSIKNEGEELGVLLSGRALALYLQRSGFDSYLHKKKKEWNMNNHYSFDTRWNKQTNKT